MTNQVWLSSGLPTKLHNNSGESKRCQSTYAWQNWQWKETTMNNYAMMMTMTSTMGKDVT